MARKDRRAEIESLIESGEMTLENMGASLGGISRERVRQLIDHYDLREKWKERRLAADSKSRRWLMKMEKTERGGKISGVIGRLEAMGLDVKKNGIRYCANGIPIQFHIMTKEWGGKYHTNSAPNNGLRIFIISTPSGDVTKVRLPDFTNVSASFSANKLGDDEYPGVEQVEALKASATETKTVKIGA